MSNTKTASAKWQLGTVRWFDEKSGDGVIKSDDGISYYVHYSAIESERRWKSLNEKKRVEFQVIEDVTFSQVSRVKAA